MDKNASMEEERGLLLILEDPVIRLDNGEQAMAIFVADEARHKMKANMSYEQLSQSYENGQPSQMHRASMRSIPDPNTLKRPFDVLVDDKELRAFANRRDVKLKCEELLRELTGASPTGVPLAVDNSDLFASTSGPSFPTLLDTGPHRTPIVPQRGITTKENNSLLRVDTHNPSEFEKGSDYAYVLRLRLVPEEGDTRHEGLTAVGVPGRIYSAMIDTTDSTFWLFQEGFRQVELDYFDYDPVESKVTVPEGPRSSLEERARINYSDRGWCGIRRWNYKSTVPLEFPSWDWKTNSQGRIVLNFPRILADRANDLMVKQPYDGNLGLAVPGWRFPWKKDIQPEDRTTFFDVLVNEGKPYVDTPSRLTLRLLWPQPVHELDRISERMRSFLYFGKGHPCGIQGPDGKLITPQYGPKIYIEESSILTNLGERQFTHWTVRLLSMTLLTPITFPPNYSSATAPDWTAYPIVMPDMDGMGGVRADLDSGSALTYLPGPVIRAMQRTWFNVPPNALGEPIYLTEPDEWKKCDIVLRFKGEGTGVVDFRCNALYFLASPWRMPQGYIAPFNFMKNQSANNASRRPPSATLGLNFFWSAIVRLDGAHRGDRPVPGVARPYVQLAPQRIVQDGRVVAGVWDIGVHENAPPRVQAGAKKQPEVFNT